jgi:transposase
VARRQCLLKEIDYKRRLAFARAHRHWTVEDWACVIFTDEMSIKIAMERLSVMWVWRKLDEKYHKDCVEPKKRSTGGMMFWGVFQKGKMGPGLFCDLKGKEKISSTVYCDQVLLGPLKQFRNESLADISDPIVIEDGALVHKSVCKEAHKMLKWPEYCHPPNSPDLNPIENIWAWMKHQITRRYKYITSQKEMRRIVLEMWAEFKDTQWDGLIASMPERIKAVIKAKGGLT